MIKDKILEVLMGGGYVSGEEMAKALGVSRNAVWNSIKALKTEGYIIEGISNRGYILKNDNDILSVSGIKRYLKSEIFGREIVVLPEAVSTNNTAKELAAKGAREGTTVIASSQTGGKGRKGRSFFSPKDKGIYMSVILRPGLSAECSTLITSFAAVAAARAVEKVCGAEVKIKWVNDLYMGGKKICGILTEALLDFESGMPEYVVLGIGINVKKTDFPPFLSEIATSIENETGKTISRNVLAAQLLNELDILYKDFEKGEFLEESRARSMVIGKNIKVICGNESYDATAEGIDSRGELIINVNGEKKVLCAGEVSVGVKNED